VNWFIPGNKKSRSKRIVQNQRSKTRTEEVKLFQRRVGATRGHDLKLIKKGVNLDAGSFSFGNRLPGWVVSGEV